MAVGQAARVSRAPAVPASLRFAPFRGSAAVADGRLTRGQLAGPAWRRLFRDTYGHAGLAVDHLTWCQAATLLLPGGAALSHRSAALLYGADVIARDQPVEATAPPDLGVRSQAGLRVVRSPLAGGDVWRRGGLPTTSPVRTAAGGHRRAARRDIDVHANWNGVKRARRVLGLARPDVEAPMETRLRLVAVGAGLPEPFVQHDVHDRVGRFVARLDLAYPVVAQVRAALRR